MTQKDILQFGLTFLVGPLFGIAILYTGYGFVFLDSAWPYYTSVENRVVFLFLCLPAAFVGLLVGGGVASVIDDTGQ